MSNLCVQIWMASVLLAFWVSVDARCNLKLCCQMYSPDSMTADPSTTPELSYLLYRFTSCPFITRLYLCGNHLHVCEDCRCIRCVVLRWVRTPHCSCRLPLRHGLTLDARIRKKRLACRHEPKSQPIFPPEFCFCMYPEKKDAQLRLTNPEYSTRDYLDEDSASTD